MRFRRSHMSYLVDNETALSHFLGDTSTGGNPDENQNGQGLNNAVNLVSGVIGSLGAFKSIRPNIPQVGYVNIPPPVQQTTQTNGVVNAFILLGGGSILLLAIILIIVKLKRA
jgi:hypothetical protein